MNFSPARYDKGDLRIEEKKVGYTRYSGYLDDAQTLDYATSNPAILMICFGKRKLKEHFL